MEATPPIADQTNTNAIRLVWSSEPRLRTLYPTGRHAKEQTIRNTVSEQLKLPVAPPPDKLVEKNCAYASPAISQLGSRSGHVMHHNAPTTGKAIAWAIPNRADVLPECSVPRLENALPKVLGGPLITVHVLRALRCRGRSALDWEERSIK